MQRKKLSRDPTSTEALFTDVPERAIGEIRLNRTPVYTFAFYHDRESAAVSVCVDTKANSAQTIASMNAYSVRHFVEAVNEGDLDDALLWNANIGRSLSLGDFEMVNVARTDVTGTRAGKHFYLGMIRAVIARDQEILSVTLDKDDLLFCCSGAKDEVQYIWSPTERAA